MGVFKTKGGYKVKSYVTGKWHRGSNGKVKVYKTKASAKRGAKYKKRR